MTNFEKVIEFTRVERTKSQKLSGSKSLLRNQLIDQFETSISNIPQKIKETILGLFLEASISDGRENSGLGKNRLSYEDVHGLLKNYDYLVNYYDNGNYQKVSEFVNKSRPNKISEDFVRSSFELLPKGIQSSLMKKGKTGDNGKNKHFISYIRSDQTLTSDKSDKNISKDIDGGLLVKRGQPGSKDRGYFVWRCILEQGGIDPYTELKLDLNSIDLEHVIAFDNKDNGKPTNFDYLSREHDNNIIICATNINQMKNNLSIKQFLDERVVPQKGKSKSEFDLVSQTYEEANKITEVTKSKSKEIVSKAQDLDVIELFEIFESEDIKYKSVKEKAKKVIDNKQDISKISSLKSWLGKEIIQSMGLGRGLTSSDGRRSVKLSSDNIYRGYLISMLENKDKIDLYKTEWENARKFGNRIDNRTSGNGQKSMLSYLIEKGLISKNVLNNSKLSKVWENVMVE